ncbi:MAG: hypothetical protein SF028_15060 [Candidatus Sumerlaeia bacterium]|nr:hypothetical protein [Candidatus Sumerlaeia bacterium]
MSVGAARHATACALLALLPALWFAPLLAGAVPDNMDVVALLLPQRVEVARQLAEGTLPLWNPRQFSGVPLAANPHPAVWYPLNIPFYFHPGAWTFGALMVLHYAVAAWGADALSSRLGARSLPAFFAGAATVLGATLAARVALPMHLATLAWVPWILLAVEHALRRPAWPLPAAVPAVAALLALQFLAGAPQVSYFTLLLLPAYWLLRAGRSRRRAALVHGATAAALFALLAGIQLLPALEFLAHSERQGYDAGRLRGQALNGSFLWRALLGGTGGPIEDTDTVNAVGLGVLALAVGGAVRRRGRALAACAAGAYLLGVGALVPLWSAALPLYESFNAPRRALLLVGMLAPVLAALGASRLLALLRAKRLPRAAGWALLGLLAAPSVWLLPRYERKFTSLERCGADPAAVAAIGGSRFLALDPTLRYAYDSRRFDYGRSLVPNMAALHGLDDAQGYDVLVPRRYGLFRNAASARSGVLYPSHGVVLSDPGSPLLALAAVEFMTGRFDRFDPSRVVPGARFDAERLGGMLDLVKQDARWPLWRFRGARPRAWVPAVARPVGSPEEAIAALAAMADPAAVALVEDPGLPPLRQLPRALAWERPDARTVRLASDRPAPAPEVWLLSENWMPGWTARGSDGAPLPVVPADAFLVAVLVPAGESAVALRYEPASFRHGAGLTALGVLLCGWVLARSRRAGSRLFLQS